MKWSLPWFIRITSYNVCYTKLLRQLAHAELVRIADVDRTGEVVCGFHQSYQPVDLVVYIAERARLATIAIDRNGFALQCLDNEVGHDPAVVRVHARAVGIENACHLDR